MFYNVLNAENLVDNLKVNLDKIKLLENKNSSLNILALKKNEIIDTHTSPVNTAVYVIKGEIELHFDAEKFNLKEKSLILFEKDAEHRVLALQDSIFMVIKI